MIWSRISGAPAGGPTGSRAALRPVLAACGLALVASLAGCSSDATDEASAEGSAAVPTYAADQPESAAPPAATGGDQQSGESTAPPPRPAPGDVVVTYWAFDGATGAVEAGGYVDGITEDGGTCTLTLTRGDTVLTGDGPALSDANTTSCGTVRVTVPAGATDDWQAVLGYRSSSGRSSSEPFTVTPR
jgi:hypothetical protein